MLAKQEIQEALCIPTLFPENSREPYIFFQLTVRFGHLLPTFQAGMLPSEGGTGPVALAVSMHRLTDRFLRGVYGSQDFSRDFAQSLSRRPLQKPSTAKMEGEEEEGRSEKIKLKIIIVLMCADGVRNSVREGKRGIGPSGAGERWR